jgi:hypothetical protein
LFIGVGKWRNFPFAAAQSLKEGGTSIMSYGTTSDLLAPAAVSWTGGLAGFRAQVERNQEHARRLVEGLDDEAFRWRPEPRRWSMAECFEHMDVSLGLYLPAIDGAVERAKAQSWRCSPTPPRPGFLAKWFVGLLEPPPKRRFRAFGPFVPQQVRPLADALPRFLRSRDELLQRLRDAEGLDLQRAKLRSPAVPLLRFSLAETFAIVIAHDRRHLWQAQQVRSAPAFPGV